MSDQLEMSPAPWKLTDKRGWSGIESADGEDLVLYAICEGEWHGRVTADNIADLLGVIVLRNAFDVQMRRKWAVEFDRDKKMWSVPAAVGWNSLTIASWSDHHDVPFWYPNPAAALIEMDKWLIGIEQKKLRDVAKASVVAVAGG